MSGDSPSGAPTPSTAPSPAAAAAKAALTSSSSLSLAALGQHGHGGHGHGGLWGLSLMALGVVFGDIGTSPLYTLKECLHALTHGDTATAVAAHASQTEVLELLSLIFWSMMMVVTVKYLAFILNADNKGEGGIFALLALLPEKWRGTPTTKLTTISVLVVIGAALLYGDGAITPAMSVLSAVEGMRVASPGIPENAVVVTTVLILIGLFAIQKRGTALVGKLFGPVMILWFGVLAGLGIFHILKNTDILSALSPHYAFMYFRDHGFHGALILGSVVLAVTGGEALYADLGHFGKPPIRLSWLLVAMPALALNYFGQGALVLSNPAAAENPFFEMVPKGAPTFALVAIATLATIIASQALITGAFSLTRQAMQLGYFPRVTVKHTAKETEGQIYIPELNMLLAVACVMLVLTFRESSKLAAAYGIAVTGTMAITSIAYFSVLTQTRKWPVWKALPLLVLFLSFDIPFFAASAYKFFQGGYVPILLGAFLTAVMLIWHEGRRLVSLNYVGKYRSFEESWREVSSDIAQRTPGTGVFMASTDSGVPPVLVHHVKRTHALHKQIFLVTVVTTGAPRVPRSERYTVEEIGHGFTRVLLYFGFLDDPHVPRALKLARVDRELDFEMEDLTYYLARERVLVRAGGDMPVVLEAIFGFLQRNSVNADRYFHIPSEQVIEVGQQIDL
jgi:KUP system potassium uptake protein